MKINNFAPFRVIAAALPVVLIGCLAGCSGDDKKVAAAPRAALVTVEDAVLRDIPVNLSAVGTVDPSATVTIISRISGELKEVHVKDGEEVSEGQLLFVIDKKPMEIALLQVQAQLESDKAKLAKAEDDLGRSQKLTKGGFNSAAQNDEARVAAISYRAAVKADEAAVEQAKLNLSYCEIRAPMAGRAGVVKVDKGNFVPIQSQPLLTIDTISPVTVTFSVPERHIMTIRQESAKAPLRVAAESRHGGAAEGQLTYIGNVDSQTGTVPLKASFPNKNREMWPGEYVQVKLQLEVQSNVVTIPSRAVVIGPKGNFIYVISDDMKAQQRLVKAGAETDGITVILEGLQAGEKVVMEGHVRLSDGITVRLPNASAQNDTPAKTEAGSAS